MRGLLAFRVVDSAQRRFGSKHFRSEFREARKWKIMPMQRYLPEYLSQNMKSLNDLNYMEKFFEERHRLVFTPGKAPRTFTKIPEIDKQSFDGALNLPTFLPTSYTILEKIRNIVEKMDPESTYNKENPKESLLQKSKSIVIDGLRNRRSLSSTLKFIESKTKNYSENKLISHLLSIYRDLAGEIGTFYRDPKEKQKAMQKYATENILGKLTELCENRTVKWSIGETLNETPLLLHAEYSDNGAMRFVQILVKLDSRQTLDIFDRFGKRMYGYATKRADCSPEDASFENSELLVFERLFTRDFTLPDWRLHSRVVLKNGASGKLFRLQSHASQ